MTERTGIAGKVAVVGIGGSRIERRSTRPIGQLTTDAIHAALADAGLGLADVDGLATYPELTHHGSPNIDGHDVVSVDFVARQLAIGPQVRWHVQTDSMVQNAFVEGVNAVASGASDTCVVFRAMHNPVGRYNVFDDAQVAGEQQFYVPYGLHRGYLSWGAAYGRYQHLYGATREDMSALILNNRVNAARNPRAYFRDVPLTMDDYLGARMLSDTICLFDLDIPVDGAIALVLTTAERAADLPGRAAYVAGYAQDVGGAGHRRSSRLRVGPPLEDVQRTGREIVDKLWRGTGLTAEDVDVVQVYDGYSFFMYWWLEAAGFCGEGEAHQFAQGGRIALDGELPTNTFGGQLGEGRLHGIGHIAEAAAQASGRAGARQVDGADVSLALVGTLGTGSTAVAFTSEPR